MRTVTVSALLSLCLSSCNVRDQEGAVDKSLPSARSIARDLGYSGVNEASLLAFGAQVDDRPLYVESALIAVTTTDGTWRLAYAYRHPKDTYPGADVWTLSTITDVHQSPSRDYRRRPSKEEVECFLRDSWWKFRPSKGFRLVRGRVFSETWKKVLGYRPDHRFPEPDD
jgi:hypothetical protein